MKINTYFWSYLAQFLLECEMFYTELYRTLKPTSYAQSLFFFFFFFFRKSNPVWDNVEKHYRAEQATDDHMVSAHCMLGN